MGIRLIALDMDGTLLDSYKKLSGGNAAALKVCIQNGIHIVPTTGRTVDGIPEAVKAIPGIRYAIATNGAIIKDMENNRILDSRKMPCQLALDILELAGAYPAMYDAYIDGRGISEPRFFDHMDDYGLPAQMQELVRRTRDVYPDIRKYVKESNQEIEKLNLFFGDLKVREEVRQILKERKDILLSSSMPFNLEINAIGAAKGEAVLRLASMLGLKPEETMAVGDGENDVSMIKLAGVGVAMGNADEALKSISDYVTDTNDRDGVALAIYKFVDIKSR